MSLLRWPVAVAMVPVFPGLLLGCSADLGQPDNAASGAGDVAITALLSVDAEPPAAAATAGLESVLHVQALDQPETDLLSRLDACAAFISRARERGGTALVRWTWDRDLPGGLCPKCIERVVAAGGDEERLLRYKVQNNNRRRIGLLVPQYFLQEKAQAGVSRSVAVVTAYLMKTNRLPFEEAYAFVQAIKPDAKMNEGFEWQLKLYEKMGCEVDVTSALYKQYHLQKLTEKYSELQDLPRDVFAADPNTSPPAPHSEVLFRCRKCRRLLFRSSSILTHVEGKGPAAFAHKKLSEPALLRFDGRSSCTSYFIEPVQWMEPALLGVLEGQLLCPKCTSKLGSFHWHGEQCSCGHWVTPAFQIHKSRVDEVKGLSIRNLQTGRRGT